MAELPERMVCVVVPVGVRAKSDAVPGPAPTVMSCGAEVVGVKLEVPL